METRVEPRRRVLVTGATGKQGGAVVRALLEVNTSVCDFEVLVLTRNTSSAAAQRLVADPKVQLISGDLNHATEIFEQAGGVGSVWGVFSVQVPDFKTDPHSDDNKEYRQGADLIDASLKYGVQHFVQTSVDRGGSASDNNPTSVSHFITKHRIERHLKEKARDSKMTFTILRPVAFMDMISPGMVGRIFGAAIGQLGDKPLQMVATRDIGIFAAQALTLPETDEYKNTAISLAGDELTLKEANEKFWKALHRPMPVAYNFMASLFLWMVPDLRTMFDWFKEVGYNADVSKCQQLNTGMLDLSAYLKQESDFVQ